MSQHTILLIDGVNFAQTVKRLGFKCDYIKLRDHMEKRFGLARAIFFNPKLPTEEFSTLTPMLTLLETNGYQLVTREIKHFANEEGSMRTKGGNMAVEIAVNAVRFAMSGGPTDHIIIASGDRDLLPAVEAIRDRGIKVSILSTKEARGKALSTDLLKAADQVIDLADMKHIIQYNSSSSTPKFVHKKTAQA